MRFFERNRKELEAKGIDPARLPPGQYATERFPVLHAGVVPDVDLSTWDFTVNGAVAEARRWSWDEFRILPQENRSFDIHCVTKWSKFDTRWTGVPVGVVWDALDPLPTATHVMVRAYHGFTANLPIDDFLREDNLFAVSFDGEPLALDHGFPVRLVVPHLYFWKSVKWVRGFTVLEADEPGFWERNGYHMYGDPFQEQRYWDR
jgi:DMSO/TMAO reductase YedYZ molybdopterin-dependent catalytic subunit